MRGSSAQVRPGPDPVESTPGLRPLCRRRGDPGACGRRASMAAAGSERRGPDGACAGCAAQDAFIAHGACLTEDLQMGACRVAARTAP